jgi:ATP-dependent DNA helicase RecG
LRIFDGVYDERMATLVAKWKQDGVEVDLDGLLVLSHLRRRPFINTAQATDLLQTSRDAAHGILDQLTLPPTALLERRGRATSATYHLSKRLASDLLGKGAYTRNKGVNPIRYAEMVKEYVRDHAAITPKQCRDLLGWGESNTDRVEISKLLRKWSAPDGFLKREGKPPKVSYSLR